jgi:hypothetical protein
VDDVTAVRNNVVLKVGVGVVTAAILGMVATIVSVHSRIVSIESSRFTAKDFSEYLKDVRVVERGVAEKFGVIDRNITEKFSEIKLSIETLRRQIGAEEVEGLKKRIEELEKKLSPK